MLTLLVKIRGVDERRFLA